MSYNIMAGTNGQVLVTTGGVPSWVNINKVYSIPSEEELEKNPALKSAWEQYLITRKLLGL